MEKVDIAVIGGGAAGLMAACAAARVMKKAGAVLVLEGNQKLGRKLLATGNGRCNLTNLAAAPAHYHGDTAATAQLLAHYTPDMVRGVFRDMGLVTKPDGEGRVYPRSGQAAAVLAALRGCAGENGAVCRVGTPVTAIRKTKRGFSVEMGGGETLEAAACILACGGAASPKHSCGGGYALAEALGHTVTPLYPALTQLVCAGKTAKSLSGVRCAARAALLADGKEICAESGDVQFTDTGLSGICVFGLSIYAAEFFAQETIGGRAHKALSAALDCLPEWTFSEVLDYLLELRAAYPVRAAGDLLAGVLNLRVGCALVQAAGIDPAQAAKRLTRGQLQRLAALVKSWNFTVTGTKGFQDAQITAGGVPLGEVDVLTMQSRKVKNLYIAGEMLNIHGDCGGYNLHFAWATGMAAGTAAAEAIRKKGEKR